MQALQLRSRSYQWRGNARGQAMLEFALTLPFLLAISIGAVVMGIALERFLTLQQVVRHAGNMYARDISFDDLNGPARGLMVQSAGGLQLSTALGDCDSSVKSVVYLTQVQITPDEPPDTFENEGQPVMLHRTLIGNSCLGESSLGSLPSEIWNPADPTDPGVVSDPFNEAGALATLPTEVMDDMIPGETVFVVEFLHATDDLVFRGFIVPTQLYTRGFF